MELHLSQVLGIASAHSTPVSWLAQPNKMALPSHLTLRKFKLLLCAGKGLPFPALASWGHQ